LLGLDEQTLERRSLARNEALFRQGEKVTAIYFVEAGRLRVGAADIRRSVIGRRHDFVRQVLYAGANRPQVVADALSARSAHAERDRQLKAGPIYAAIPIHFAADICK